MLSSMRTDDGTRIKKVPEGMAIPLTDEEIDAILLVVQLISSAGAVKTKARGIVERINSRDAVPVESVSSSALVGGGEEHASIAMGVLGVAQDAFDRLMLMGVDGTLN